MKQHQTFVTIGRLRGAAQNVVAGERCIAVYETVSRAREDHRPN